MGDTSVPSLLIPDGGRGLQLCVERVLLPAGYRYFIH